MYNIIISVYEEDEKDQEYLSEIILRIPLTFKISDIAWNSNGTILAITNYIDNHQGPCCHQTNITFLKFSGNISDKNYIKIEVETNSCIKAVEGHPILPNIFVACSYIGEIYYINLNLTDQIEYISKIDSNFHKECIVGVKWVLYEKLYYIISISDEGRLLVWNPEDQLKYPTLGFNLKTKAAKLEMPINPTTISENPFEQFNFIIGTLDGNLYRCIFDKPGTKNEALFQQSSGVVWRNSVKLLMSNMSYDDLIKMKTYIEKFCKDKNIIDLNAEEFYKLKPDLTKFYKNSLKSNFEKHISCVTTVSYNGFIKGLFVTTSYDGSIRIYNNV